MGLFALDERATFLAQTALAACDYLLAVLANSDGLAAFGAAVGIFRTELRRLLRVIERTVMINGFRGHAWPFGESARSSSVIIVLVIIGCLPLLLRWGEGLLGYGNSPRYGR